MDRTPLSQYWSFPGGVMVCPKWAKDDPLTALRWMFNQHGLSMAKALWLKWSMANPVPEMGFSPQITRLLDQHRLTREFIEAAEVEATRWAKEAPAHLPKVLNFAGVGSSAPIRCLCCGGRDPYDNPGAWPAGEVACECNHRSRQLARVPDPRAGSPSLDPAVAARAGKAQVAAGVAPPVRPPLEDI